MSDAADHLGLSFGGSHLFDGGYCMLCCYACDTQEQLPDYPKLSELAALIVAFTEKHRECKTREP